MSPVLLGFLGLSIFLYAQKGLNWSFAKSTFIAFLGTVYFVALRASWNQLREELGLVFLFVVFILLLCNRKNNSLRHYLLLSLGIIAVVLSHQLVSVRCFGVILVTVVNCSLRKDFTRSAKANFNTIACSVLFVIVNLFAQPSIFASANQNEKRHSLTLLEKAKRILKHCKAKVRSIVADSQYSGSKLRCTVEKATIPYPANHWKGVEGLLRVDRKFRTYGSEEDKTEYHKRPPIEAVNSFLKTQFSMANNKVRGLAQVTFYALCSILCLVINREAAQRIGRYEKAVSPTYFNT
jgi:hypothetical protein